MAAASAWQPCWKSCIAEGVFHKEISIPSIACSTPPKARLAWTRNLASLQLCLQQPHLALRVACSASVSHGGETPVKLEDINFKKLQNGSDIRGVAIEGVEGEPVNLSEVATEAIAAAFSDWLVERKSGKRQLRISVGHDSRISADVLQAAVARGVAGAGLDVILYGLASTPAMFNSTITNREDLFCPVDGAIMITASHLPYNRNGLKFFTSDGGLGKGDISSILARAAKIYGSLTEERLHASARAAANVVKHANFMNHYASDLVETVRRAAGDNPQPLEGFHIIVDAGNGAGGFFAGSVLAPLGAITSGSQFLEPDGMFPNHIPNPEDKEAMDAIQKAVIEHKADLGIIFDTDVDRAAAVDSSGREINRNRLIALISAIVLAEHPGTTIVTDSVTSDGLTTFIEEKLGGKHHRYKRGYKNVIDEGIRLNAAGQECHLAIETSGHGALKENHWLDDGAYLMVKVLVKLAAAKASGEGGGSKVLTDLIEELQEAEVALEFRIKIDQNHPDIIGRSFQEYGNAVLSHLESLSEKASELKKAPVNYEGVRISGFGGWFLLRLSLHDPVLPLNIEAPSHEAASKLGSLVISAIKDFKALNLKPVEQYLAQNKVELPLRSKLRNGQTLLCFSSTILSPLEVRFYLGYWSRVALTGLLEQPNLNRGHGHNSCNLA